VCFTKGLRRKAVKGKVKKPSLPYEDWLFYWCLKYG
jgi:hypothetical protein